MLTIGIKTFCRPHTLNESLHTLFTKNIIYYPIIIVDDSLNKYKVQNMYVINKYKKKYSQDIKLIFLPFDSGLSKGRNVIVNNCKTKYLMIIDDSRTFTTNLNVTNMIRFLEENPDYHLISGVIDSRKGINSHFSGLFNSIYENKDGVINIHAGPIKKIENKLFKNIYDTNIGLNVFIARTECLKNVKWDDRQKLGEHKLFFYDWFKYGYKCAICFDCKFECVNFRKYPDNLSSYRKRASTEFNSNDRIRINFSDKTKYKYNISHFLILIIFILIVYLIILKAIYIKN